MREASVEETILISTQSCSSYVQDLKEQIVLKEQRIIPVLCMWWGNSFTQLYKFWKFNTAVEQGDDTEYNLEMEE